MTFLPPKDPKLAEYLWELTRFCERNGGKWCFSGLKGERLFRYVAFCHLTGRLMVVIQGDQVRAVATAWPEWTEHVEARAAERLPQFSWTNTLPKDAGDALFVADVVTSPNHEREDLQSLMFGAMAKWRDLMDRRLFTYRRGKLVELSQKVLGRLLKPHERKHGKRA